MTLWRRHYDNEPPHRSWPPAESAQPSSAAHTEPTPPRAIGIDGSPQVSLSHSMPRRLPLTMCWTTIATSVLLLLAGSVLADPQPLPTELRRPSVANDPQAPAPDDGPGGSASSSSAVAQWVQCPDAADNSACPCHQFESGLFLECPGTTEIALRSTLQLITAPIQSLSIFDFDRSVERLPDVFAAGAQVRHLQFSHSHLQSLRPGSLKALQSVLESLSIVNGRLQEVPKNELTDMPKLQMLDFEANEIHDLPDYTFFAVRLAKLNLKSNRLEHISSNAFAGLEESMLDIDLSDNRLKSFPMAALARLEHLRSLRLATNAISAITFPSDLHRITSPTTGRSHSTRPFIALTKLDLNFNRFEQITEDTFRWFPSLTTLSLYANRIHTVHRDAFATLQELESLDMSHNKLITMATASFAANGRLQTLDLSHNHLHHIGGLFSNLPDLVELSLTENNILEVTADAFSNSSAIKVVYLEDNAIQRIDPNALQTLHNLEQLYMRSNFLETVPKSLFSRCLNLTSLSLDGNLISALDPGTFANLNVLREIRLHNNRLQHIKQRVFHPLPGLLELHLQHNEIGKIDTKALASLVSLQHINLQHNAIRELDVIFPPNSSSLLSIQMDSNHINVVLPQALAGLKSVEIMWFCHNRLNKLDKLMFRDLQHVEKLYLCNNSITTIQADTFQRMKALTFLDLSNNKLRVIKNNFFVDLRELDELNLSANEISDIQTNSFATLNALRVLDLSFNLLVQFAWDIFRGDIPLVQINLRNCMLKKIEPKSFGNLLNLNEINLEHNQLTLADVKNLDVPGLRTLRLSYNDFSAPGENVFDKFPSLQTLSLDHCDIANLSTNVFAKNINLVKIDLAHNLLRSINRNCFNGLNVFKDLRLDHNLLTDFPHIALYNISTLESLSLAENALTSIDFFKLNGLPYLRSLRLARNSIASLSGFNAVNLTQLDSVDLSHNQLRALPGNFLQNAITLQRLDLSFNRFRQVPSSALSDTSLPRLGWLNFAANPLDRIYGTSLERYALLREIHISHTNLTILTSKDFEAFVGLQHLYLVHNRINRISPGAFTALQQLLTLDMSINELELLPRERLQGLHALRVLNISQNNLHDLEEFTVDIRKLQVLDISWNQLHRVSHSHFANLVELRELLLAGNRISTVSAEAFKTLNVLATLDLRKNYLETVPLEALKVVETHIRRLRLEENPLHCSCDSQELWQWLANHPKWTRTLDDATAAPSAGAAKAMPSTSAAALATNATHHVVPHLRCELPPELRGAIFAQLEPHQFCNQPLILKLAIQDIQTKSVLVSWQGREHTGLTGFQIRYQAIEGLAVESGAVDRDEVHSELLSHLAHSAKLSRLVSSTRYRICVSGLGGNHRFSSTDPTTTITQPSHPAPPLYASSPIFERRNTTSALNPRSSHHNRPSDDLLLLHSVVTHHPLLTESTNSRCTEVRTLEPIPNSHLLDELGRPSRGQLYSFVTRRKGLIIGSFLGIIVFFGMITVLGWMKLRKRRIENAKRLQMPQPPGEYTTYRHFSIPADEQSSVLREGMCNHHPSPAYISGAALGTTTTTSSISC